MFDHFVFDIVFILKCKSENGNRVILTDPTVFNPNPSSSLIDTVLCDGGHWSRDLQEVVVAVA